MEHIVSYNTVAIITPLSDSPVEMLLTKEETGQTEQQEFANTYIILPGVRFRIVPSGGSFHMAILRLKISENP